MRVFHMVSKTGFDGVTGIGSTGVGSSLPQAARKNKIIYKKFILIFILIYIIFYKS